jgi:hypothetical protein
MALGQMGGIGAGSSSSSQAQQHQQSQPPMSDVKKQISQKLLQKKQSELWGNLFII